MFYSLDVNILLQANIEMLIQLSNNLSSMQRSKSTTVFFLLIAVELLAFVKGEFPSLCGTYIYETMTMSTTSHMNSS